jgi:hypothetical protein
VGHRNASRASNAVRIRVFTVRAAARTSQRCRRGSPLVVGSSIGSRCPSAAPHRASHAQHPRGRSPAAPARAPDRPGSVVMTSSAAGRRERRARPVERAGPRDHQQPADDGARDRSCRSACRQARVNTSCTTSRVGRVRQHPQGKRVDGAGVAIVDLATADSSPRAMRITAARSESNAAMCALGDTLTYAA